MKLYVWHNVMPLADYNGGTVVAFARSEREAIEIAVATAESEWSVGARLHEELWGAEPDVYTEPMAVVVWGSA